MRHLNWILFTLLLVVAGAVAAPTAPHAAAVRSAAPAGASAYFIAPHDGDVITGPVTVVMGLKGMGIAPAGVQHENTGHFHLIVDADLPPADMPIPKDEQHLHFGGGQTQTVLTLKPGKHSLQILMGDYAHMSFDPPVASDKITITVK
ncbi:MAG TPA: DUF4399 domain-containing protein [Gammaproteobacteria bacterium]|nr:DUF4399 domain-containing protein [Gammaproteobacteria bacterium]